MSRPNLRHLAGLVAGLAGVLLSGGAVAKDMVVGQCILTVPDDWSVTGGSSRSPDGVVTIQVREVTNGQVFIAFQRAFGVRAARAQNPELTIMFATVGDTRRYYAVAPPRPERACTAQVTSSNAARRGEAAGIAVSLQRRPLDPARAMAARRSGR